MNTTRSIFMVGGQQAEVMGMRKALEDAGFKVPYEKVTLVALPKILREAPDVVMVNVAASDRNGLLFCAELRDLYQGLIVLVMDEAGEGEQIRAFGSGADEVVVKPVSVPVLAARIQAMLKRIERIRPATPSHSITVGNLTVDASRREAYIDQHSLNLTTMQFDLLWFLVQNAGMIITRDDLCRLLFDSEFNGVDRAVDVYISRIRKKLGDDPRRPFYLKTVRGMGYLFSGNNGTHAARV